MGHVSDKNSVVRSNTVGDKYRVAVIGCGGRSSMHIDAYQFIERGEVVACCDVVKEKADERAAEFGIKAYYDASDMIEKEKPDLIHITTPPTARVNLLSLAAECGVPACTVEKPLATGVEDWHQLQEIEKAGKTKIAVCHQFRWHSDFIKCQEALKSGKLGKVLFLDISAGMNVSGQGTHVLNYGFSLNDESPILEVFGAAFGAEGMSGYHPGPDTTAGYLSYENGVRGFWNNGVTAPRCGDPETDYQHVRLAAYAEKGRVLWQEFGIWEIASEEGIQTGTFGGRDTWVENNLKAQATFHNAMFDWIADSSKIPGTNFKQSLHEWEVILALYASALERRPISLATFDPPGDLFDRLKKALAG